MRKNLCVLLGAAIVLTAAGCQKTETTTSGAATSAGVTPFAAAPPIAILDTPREGSTVANKSWGTGWALSKSGIFQVTATADNGAVAPAKLGQAFSGVKAAYPDMPDNDTAGFIFGVPDLPAGPHELTVEIVAKDGQKLVLKRKFNVQ